MTWAILLVVGCVLLVFVVLDMILARLALNRVAHGCLPYGLPLGSHTRLLTMASAKGGSGRDEYRLDEAEKDIDELETGKANAVDVADMVKVAAEDRKDLRVVIVDVATLKTKIGIYAAIGSAAGTVLVTGVVGLAIKLSGA